ncbi:MAG: hypothetical protein EBY23_04345 [Actinobacteria bacterium]|nr:hypothetical protein [Actinomycetota bacterium]
MKQENMVEDDVEKVDDDYNETDLPQRSKLALAFADAFLGVQGAPSIDVQEQMKKEFSTEQIAEMGIGLALFHGFSKLLIVTGCEPEEMERTVLSAPGS